MKRGALISLVLWVAGLIVISSALLSISEIEGNNAKLLVLLNIVNILFVMMLSTQILISEK